MGDSGGGHWLVRTEWRPDGLSVCLPLLNLPLHHKVQKFSSGTGSPRWSRKRAVKRLWCGVWCSSQNSTALCSQGHRSNCLVLYYVHDSVYWAVYPCPILDKKFIWRLGSREPQDSSGYADGSNEHDTRIDSHAITASVDRIPRCNAATSNA